MRDAGRKQRLEHEVEGDEKHDKKRRQDESRYAEPRRQDDWRGGIPQANDYREGGATAIGVGKA